MLRKFVTATAVLALLGALGVVGWLLAESQRREADLARRVTVLEETVANLEETVAKQKQSAELTKQVVTGTLEALPALSDRVDLIEQSAFDLGRPDGFGQAWRAGSLRLSACPSPPPTQRSV